MEFNPYEMNRIKTGSDFSGVGAFDQALMRLGIEQDKKFACDMDKYARQTYIHNYGEPFYYPENVYDRAIPTESLDVYMTSPPCQAFSLAGKRKGEDDKRGVLFYNSHEFIKLNNPRYFIFENVKGLLSDDGGKTFQRWIDMLAGKTVNGNPVIFPHEDSVPYHVYYQVLNAKHYGVPQNRERIFIIGIRDDQDSDFTFPKPFPLVKRLKDVLESEVDEKYFLSDKMIAGLLNKNDQDNGFTFSPKNSTDTASCVTARCFKMGADDNYIKVKSATQQGYEIATDEDSINFSVPNSETRRGRVGKGVAQTLDTACNQGVIVGVTTNDRIFGWHENENIIGAHMNDAKRSSVQEHIYHKETGVCTTINTAHQPKLYSSQIRRLTPRECFRLMDFPDTLIDNVNFGNELFTDGLILTLNTPIWNVPQKIAIENQKQLDIALNIIKGIKNTETRISSLSTVTVKTPNVKSKIAATVFSLSDGAQAIITQIENGEILYTLNKDSLKSLRKRDRELLIQEVSQGLGEKECRNIGLFIKLELDNYLKNHSKYTISTAIRTITNLITSIYSIPKENTLNVIINYKDFAPNLLERESLHLKMAGTLLSDSQLYKQAGNSIVVNVLAEILRKLKL